MARKPSKPAPEVAPATPQPPPAVRVRFVRTHTHDGVDYSPGDEIDVLPQMADLLRHYSAID